MKKIVMLGVLLAPLSGLAADGGTVILMRGVAKTDSGKTLALKDLVEPGTTIKTESKSFVKLLFSDKTQMNIGPDTTLKLEQTRAGDPSLVNLVGGQIRAKVSKDLLKTGGSAPQEKMIVKTKTAAMGIRGTDFNVSFNQQNNITALITFEGNVAMVRTEPGQNPAEALTQTDKVQSVGAGQFSGAQPDQALASIPVKISPSQLESLKGNETFRGLGEKSSEKGTSLASPVPPGVDPRNFASGSEKLLEKATGTSAAAPEAAGAANALPPEGSYNAQSGAYAPRAGGFIDLSSGRYVPPPPGSSFDPNTGVFTPPTAVGGIDPNTGMYVPPKGVELDPVKGFVPEAPRPGVNETKAAPGAPPPPALALAQALNQSSSPTNAGLTATFTPAFSPTAGAPGQFALAPPPPPPPPSNAAGLPPPPPGPVNDPTCVTCINDNIQQMPVITNVRFNITVTP